MYLRAKAEAGQEIHRDAPQHFGNEMSDTVTAGPSLVHDRMPEKETGEKKQYNYFKQ